MLLKCSHVPSTLTMGCQQLSKFVMAHPIISSLTRLSKKVLKVRKIGLVFVHPHRSQASLSLDQQQQMFAHPMANDSFGS
jgi:hypothetical protein